jgi:hypothetical protein
MAHRCPGAKVAGAAELTGYDLLFKGRRYESHATVERLPGGSVPVLLWDISGRHERALDYYEGWPKVYRKESQAVRFEGKTRQGMLYIMTDSNCFGNPAPSYYNTIYAGYKAVGFDVSYLDQAVEQSRQLALEQDLEWNRLAEQCAQELDNGQQTLLDMRWW